MKSVSIALFAGLVCCASLQLASAGDAPRYKEEILYSFCNQPSCTDGAQPYARLLSVKGTLYGTTNAGGANDSGTVFSLHPRTGALKVLYTFCQLSACHDGAFPDAGLIDVNGMFYGTTLSGGEYDYGEVFSLDPNTGAESVMHSFKRQGSDGAWPNSSLINVKGSLYGTTQLGGLTGSAGTVFGINLSTGIEGTVYSFCSQANCADGTDPGGLININGKLYGVTGGGGASGPAACDGIGCGTIFTLNHRTGLENVIYSFCKDANCTDGAEPVALTDVDGTFFGLTTFGGGGADCSNTEIPGCGTVFSFDPNTGAEKVLYSFCSQQNCADGSRPVGSLIFVDGRLYGATSFGGNTGCSGTGCGTVFSINPRSGSEVVVHTFSGGVTDGSYPQAGLTVLNGNLYGTTFQGGSSGGGGLGDGTVFVLKKQP